MENAPYNIYARCDVLYDEGTGEVYFECDECTVLESSIDDIEDEFDRMTELMEMGRI